MYLSKYIFFVQIFIWRCDIMRGKWRKSDKQLFRPSAEFPKTGWKDLLSKYRIYIYNLFAFMKMSRHALSSKQEIFPSNKYTMFASGKCRCAPFRNELTQIYFDKIINSIEYFLGSWTFCRIEGTIFWMFFKDIFLRWGLGNSALDRPHGTWLTQSEPCSVILSEDSSHSHSYIFQVYRNFEKRGWCIEVL